MAQTVIVLDDPHPSMLVMLVVEPDGSEILVLNGRGIADRVRAAAP